MTLSTSPHVPAPLLTQKEVEIGQTLLCSLSDHLNEIILGQSDLIEKVVIALASRGHLLLEGLPGLGKTELCKAMSSLLGLSFRRIQFTPDLLPSDITGGPILEEKDGKRQFVFHKGPLFASIVLADEINRASPKTQSALLEAMQEQRVTVLGETHLLPKPFFVLATQNPIEMEGTYPLPEAQLDRFLFKLEVLHISEEVLTKIVTQRRRGSVPQMETLFSSEILQQLFSLVDQVYLPEMVGKYIARLVAATQPNSDLCPKELKTWIKFGVSPRAAISMAEASRAAALFAGRPNVDFQDVEKIALSAMAHRLVLQHTARISGITATSVIKTLLINIDPLGKKLPGVVS